MPARSHLREGGVELLRGRAEPGDPLPAGLQPADNVRPVMGERADSTFATSAPPDQEVT
jgi:hypothetical protein